MAAPRAELQDRFRAAFLGMAIGDALGFPLRGVPPAALRRLPDLAEDFAPRPRGRFPRGQFSAHTQLAVVAAEAAVEQGAIDGRTFARHFADAYGSGHLVQPGSSIAAAAERLARGLPWMTSGAPIGERHAAAIPPGLCVGLFETDPLRIPRHCEVLAVVTHKDPTAAAASSAFAQGIRTALAGDASSPHLLVERMAKSAAVHDQALAEELRQVPRLLTWELDRATELIRRVGLRADEVHDEQGLSPHPWPVLLLGTYVALRLPHDFRAAMAGVLRWGGEASAAAGIAGALIGAARGESALPARLRHHVLDQDRLAACADGLLDARLRRSTAVRSAAG